MHQGILNLDAIGQTQFETFWEDRLKGKSAIGQKISKNNIPLAGNIRNEKGNNKLSYSTAALTKLQSAIQLRESSCKVLFKSEIYGVAHSIAESTTKLYHSKKSEMLDRFKKWYISNLSSCNEKAAMRKLQ